MNHKFRAWDTKRKQMYSDGQINSDCFITFDGKIVSPVNHFPDGVEMVEEKDLVRLDATGLHDCKGNDIYEGDYVKIFEKFNKIVVWKNGSFGYIESEDLIPFAHNYYFKWDRMGKSERIEVIGNIWENGDLLKCQ